MHFEVTIPVYNEEPSLRQGVTTLHNFLEASSIDDWSIAIADNGSTDKTAEIGKLLEQEFESVRLVQVGEKGVGLALKRSWEGASADVVGYVDLDMATDVCHLEEVFQQFTKQGALIVSGSRNLPQSTVVGRSLLRTITSKVFNLILKSILLVRFTDGMCGFKFIKREVFTRLREKGLANDGWFFCTEMLIRAEWEGCTVVDIPVRWTDDGESKVKLFDLTKYYLGEIIKLRLEKSGLR